MPSPPIPHSISAPNISVRRHPSSLKGTSRTKNGSSHMLSKKKSSELTEESLEEFNRRNAEKEKKDANASPYYKGLTDFTLDIKKDKFPSVVSCPVIPTHDEASISSSTRSSFVTIVQQLRAFFLSFKNKGKERISASSTSLSSRTSKDTDSEREVRNGVTEFKTTLVLKKGKPVRERVLSTTDDLQPPQPLKTSPPLPPRQTSAFAPPPPPASPSPSPLQTSSASPPPPPPPPRTVVARTSTPIPRASAPQPRQTQQMLVIENADVNAKELNESKEKTILFTWADNYRPHKLTEFICNQETAIKLRDLAKTEDCSHFIFEGQAGVGKRTMIMAFLREVFGPDKVVAREEWKEFYLKGEQVRSIKVKMKRSSQHVEINLSELKGYEKHVIVELIKEKSNNLSNYTVCSHDNCQAIILYEADKLSTDALLYIKWLLERYKGCNKVFFCCNENKKLEPIQSICRVVNLAPPSDREIVDVLMLIAKEEGIELAPQMAEKIAINSKNNLRQAIRSFEATWRYHKCSSQLKDDQEIMTGWEDAIAKVAKDIVKEQSPRQLFIIRGELQKLIEYNVSPVFIFKTVVEELKKHLDDSSQIYIDNLYKEYIKGKRFSYPRNQTEEMCKRQNDREKNSVHQFMKIEEFIAKFMSWYKCLTANNKLNNMKMKGKLDDRLMPPEVCDTKLKENLMTP